MEVDPRVQKLAVAISKAEGFGIPGAIPTKANNPGDMVIPGWQGLKLGSGVSVFDTLYEGWFRLYREIEFIIAGESHVYNLDMTLQDMANKWTSTQTQQEAWATNVASELGVATTTTLREILVA